MTAVTKTLGPTVQGLSLASAEYEDAVVAAIRCWPYEPMLVDGNPAPFCVTLTANVEVR